MNLKISHEIQRYVHLGGLYALQLLAPQELRGVGEMLSTDQDTGRIQCPWVSQGRGWQQHPASPVSAVP